MSNPEPITPSSGNVFADLGFSPEEAALLQLRGQVMADLRATLTERGWTQVQAAAVLGVSQSRTATWCAANGSHSAWTC